MVASNARTIKCNYAKYGMKHASNAKNNKHYKKNKNNNENVNDQNKYK